MNEWRKIAFANRGALLTLPAALLAAMGKPSAFSIAVGLPIAFAGELLRCWAVGYSGVTTRGSEVEAPALTTAGPYAYVRNPLYVGNFITALGFATAFTGGNCCGKRTALVLASLGTMAGVYAAIIPHEEEFLHSKFGDAFERYVERVPAVLPSCIPYDRQQGSYDPGVIAKAETRTFATLGAMLGVLALKALRA